MSRREMPPLPTATLEVTPTADEVVSFLENGYLVVDRITTDDELAWLTEIYESVFAPDGADGRLGPFDFGGEGDGNGGDGPALLGQAFFPEMTYPELLGTVYHRNARRYAAALLGVDIGELSSWSHMIRKLPGGREAPWHQDEAYWDPELSYHALGCWLPLHDVTVDMGAMQFIPGFPPRGAAPPPPRGRRPRAAPPRGRRGGHLPGRRLPAAGRRRHVPPPPHPAPHGAQRDRPAPAGVPHRVPDRTPAGRHPRPPPLGRRPPRRHQRRPTPRLPRRRPLRPPLTHHPPHPAPRTCTPGNRRRRLPASFLGLGAPSLRGPAVDVRLR